MLTFEKLKPGAVRGEHPFWLTDDAAAEWTALFPDDAECLPAMPPAMVAMVIMQAFVTLLHDRPPGNIHAGQKFWIRRLRCMGNCMGLILQFRAMASRPPLGRRNAHGHARP